MHFVMIKKKNKKNWVITIIDYAKNKLFCMYKLKIYAPQGLNEWEVYAAY